MASITSELRIRLRNEARNLLDEAAKTKNPSKRRALLGKAYSLIQEADVLGQMSAGASPAATPPALLKEAMGPQHGDTGATDLLVGPDADPSGKRSSKLRGKHVPAARTSRQ